MWARENCLKADWKKCESNVTVRTWRWIDISIWCDIECGYSFIILFRCFLSDYGGSSTMKFNTIQPAGYSSKSSYMYSGSRTMVSTTSSHCFSMYSHTSWKYWANRVTCHSAGVSTKQSKLWKSMTCCWCPSESSRTQQVWYFTADCDEISSGFSSPPSRFPTERRWICATDVWAWETFDVLSSVSHFYIWPSLLNESDFYMKNQYDNRH